MFHAFLNLDSGKGSAAAMIGASSFGVGMCSTAFTDE